MASNSTPTQSDLAILNADLLVYIAYQIEKRPEFAQQAFSLAGARDMEALYAFFTKLQTHIKHLYTTQTEYQEILPTSPAITQPLTSASATSPEKPRTRTPKSSTKTTATPTATPPAITFLTPEILLDAIKSTLAERNSEGIIVKSSAFHADDLHIDPFQIDAMTDPQAVVKLAEQLQQIELASSSISLGTHFHLGCCVYRLKQICPRDMGLDAYLRSVGYTASKSSISKHLRFYIFVSKFPILLALSSISYTTILKHMQNILLWLPDHVELSRYMIMECPTIAIKVPANVVIKSLQRRVLGSIPQPLQDDAEDVDSLATKLFETHVDNVE